MSAERAVTTPKLRSVTILAQARWSPGIPEWCGSACSRWTSLARELRKRGVRVKLQEQPFRVLEALIERPGEIVTREQLKERLWAQDEFVEFDKSLNTAVQKIRQVLDDSARSPRFLETIPKTGYRFIAPITQPGQAPPIEQPPRTARARLGLFVGLGLAATALAIAFLVMRAIRSDAPGRTHSSSRVVNSRRRHNDLHFTGRTLGGLRHGWLTAFENGHSVAS